MSTRRRGAGPFLGLLVIGCVGGCAPAQLRPLDLRYTAVDINGFPLNPLLGEQVNHPQGPGGLAANISTLSCIPPDQGDVSDNDWANAWYLGDSTCTHVHVLKNTGNGLFGHVRFMPVTVQGRITFAGHSVQEKGEDDDYEFNIATADNALGSLGRTLNNDGKTALVHSEFDSDQAIDPLLDNVDEDDPFWWKAFKNAVDSDDPHQGAAAEPLMHDLPLIAIGMYDLDCFHPCGVELHPLYIIVVHLHTDLHADRWVFLAFNNGDQGYNGGDNVGLYPSLQQNIKFNGFDNQYSVVLPEPAGAATDGPIMTHKDVRISPGDNDLAIPAGNYFGSTYLKQRGLRLDFRLQDPSLQGDHHWVMMGDITLDWNMVIPPIGRARRRRDLYGNDATAVGLMSRVWEMRRLGIEPRTY